MRPFGHTLEVAVASGVCIALVADQVPLLPEARDLVEMGLLLAGNSANRNYCTHQVHRSETLDPVLLDLLADAQTSGGLLISLPEDQPHSLLADLKAHGVPSAALLGSIMDGAGGTIELL